MRGITSAPTNVVYQLSHHFRWRVLNTFSNISKNCGLFRPFRYVSYAFRIHTLSSVSEFAWWL